MKKDNCYGEFIEFEGELYELERERHSIRMRHKSLDNTLHLYLATEGDLYDWIVSDRSKAGRTGPDKSTWWRVLRDNWASKPMHKDIMKGLGALYSVTFKGEMPEDERTRLLVRLSCRKVS